MDTQDGTSGIETELTERRVCSECVGEKFLRARIVKIGDQGKCFYCGQEGRTFSVDEMADEIESAFDEHYYQTGTEPSALEYAMTRDSPHGWFRDGEPVIEVVGSVAEIDEAPARDICEVLADRHYDMEAAKMGEECPFDSDSYYAERDTDDREYSEQWRFFENSLKSEARFFSRTAEATLAALFESLHEHRTSDGKPVIVQAGPGTMIHALFRARVFQSDEKLEAALKRPDLEIGPPPSVLAPAGRMNARGISVFYGATALEIAVAEVRPPVGSRVAVGKFEIIRSVSLLDVEALRSVTVSGSIFDREFDRSLKRAKFLERLSHRLTMPVMPDDEPFDYLATQAVADFLATVAEPPIDGIIYPSVQSAEGQFNIVLFQKAARVEMFDLPKGVEIDAQLYQWTDEGREPDYWVSEQVPAADATKEDNALDGAGFAFIGPDDSNREFDGREVTLRLDAESLQVRHVEKFDIKTVGFPVHRHRSKKREYKF